MQELPLTLQRLALEVDGWLDLGCPDRALDRIGPLLRAPGAQSVALPLRIRALVDLQRFADALLDIDELKKHEHKFEWIELTEAWCRKRTNDLPGAVACMERLLARSHRSAIAHFNLGCYLTLMGQRDRAIDALSVACGLEPTFRDNLDTEADLVSLRGDPKFEALRPSPHG